VSQELIHPGYYMVALDLENQFFQVKLRPYMRRYLGFAVPDPAGGVKYYQFRVMPYGMKTAVSVATRLLKPVKAFLHKLGVKFSIYVDDGRISCHSKVKCHAQLCLAIHVL
jgi:Reverse transcriptase (RNA-dependent DNA polymerase)